MKDDVHVPIACSLDTAGQQARTAEWRALLGAAAGRRQLPGGVRVRFDDVALAADAARLAAAELECCPFFEFALRLDHTGIALDITAPAGAEALVTWLIGAEGTCGWRRSVEGTSLVPSPAAGLHRGGPHVHRFAMPAEL